MKPDRADKQELLQKFGATVANWLNTREQVEKTGGASGDFETQQHDFWLTVDRYNTDSLKRLFDYASEWGVDETELSRAAGVSPEKLRDIRESLN
ncbi:MULTISPECIES: hypothetical protein [unclassified Mycobacterium]|uniref:hypothetical protein n=1 Tax=unclassified Mycobacterium TaxID=2642494 RepID=UPI000ABC7842|nr:MULTISPECIES: hypothetical protein [unclassified Mycobacterium]